MFDIYTVIFVIVIAFVSFVPMWIAIFRRHCNKLAIFNLNLLVIFGPLSFGWLVGGALVNFDALILIAFALIGWVVALVWSFTNHGNERHTSSQQVLRYNETHEEEKGAAIAFAPKGPRARPGSGECNDRRKRQDREQQIRDERTVETSRSIVPAARYEAAAESRADQQK